MIYALLSLYTHIHLHFVLPSYNSDLLIHSISIQETQGGKTGVGKTRNNLCGIRRNGRFVKYNTKQESLDDCKRVWKKYYKVFPTIKEAKRWAGEKDAKRWLSNVTQIYLKNLK